MTPWFTMPGTRDGLHDAAVADVRQNLGGLSCAIRLLHRRLGGGPDRALLAAMQVSLRRAERALRRLPSQPDR
jgi:hypothetical protein